MFASNAIYIEDPYILDKLSSYVDDDMPYMYRYRFNRFDYSHNNKLSRLLMRKSASSLIEQSINDAKYAEIIDKISIVIPGTLTKKDTGFYYEEPNKTPLKVQNLATGAKMFSIVRNLLEKGEINFDTILILDEPEAHLHPEWQNVFAEIIVLLIKELNTTVLLTTHSPNFLMALEAYSKQYMLDNRTSFYMAKHNEETCTVNYECVNGRLSEIYSTFATPLIQVKKLRDLIDMITCERIKKYLDTKYPYIGTLASLSNNSKITSQENAYNFDEIKRKVYPECCSADALLIGKRINLIEFKTGFATPDITETDKIKKENLKLKIKAKASDSLRILDINIIGQIQIIDNDQLDSRIKKVYCAVIDVENNSVLGEDVLTDIIAQSGKISNSTSYKTLIENSLKVFQKETDQHEYLFYNQIFVFYDYEFDQKYLNL